MRVALVTGSPHAHGTSALLADEFARGAQESGCEVTRFNAARADVHPCIGCERCHTEGACTFDDDMEQLASDLRAADVVALATPIYYWNMTAQLKAAIDRLYFPQEGLKGNKRLVLLATANNPTSDIMDSLLIGRWACTRTAVRAGRHASSR